MDPLHFYWNGLGRYLLPEKEWAGELTADVNRSLARAYPHALSDIERAAQKIEYARRALPKLEDLRKAVRDLAKYQAGHELLEGGGFGETSLTKTERELLQRACEKENEPKPHMRDLRLTSEMMGIVKDNGPSLLVANIKPTHSTGIEHRVCGLRPCLAYLMDCIADPPDGPFMVLRFDRTVMTVEDLRLNISTNRIAVATPGRSASINRGRYLTAVQMAQGCEPRLLHNIARLAILREQTLDGIQEIDAQLDKKAEQLPEGVDLYDLLDTLPPYRSLEWAVLMYGINRNHRPTDHPKTGETP